MRNETGSVGVSSASELDTHPACPVGGLHWYYCVSAWAAWVGGVFGNSLWFTNRKRSITVFLQQRLRVCFEWLLHDPGRLCS